MYLTKEPYITKYDMYRLYGDDSLIIAESTNEATIKKILEKVKELGVFNFHELPYGFKVKLEYYRPVNKNILPITKEQYKKLDPYIIDIY